MGNQSLDVIGIQWMKHAQCLDEIRFLLDEHQLQTIIVLLGFYLMSFSEHQGNDEATCYHCKGEVLITYNRTSRSSIEKTLK